MMASLERNITSSPDVSDSPENKSAGKKFELPDDSGKPIYRSELPDDSGEYLHERGAAEDSQEKTTTESCSLEKQQNLANETAREYNTKYNPVERVKNKGYTDICETPNGGVSFKDSNALYCNDGKKGIGTIEATGNRTRDFDAANKKMGLAETPDGYVWHHLDDYDVKSNTVTLQLVKDEAHNASKPHSGGCAQYDAIHGASYNPVKKEEHSNV